MKKILKISILSLLFIAFSSLSAIAQQHKEPEVAQQKTRILFLFDASQSMFARWQSDMRITIAQNLLSNLMDSLKNVDNLELALRVFGHQKKFPPQDCDDTKLEVPFGKNNAERIKNRLKTIMPRGTTPIAQSLEAAGGDFPPCDNCRNIIILITDGIEECGGDPCAVSRALQKQGIILRPFVIGIGRDFSADYECVGDYYDASSEQQFMDALRAVISQALNNTTLQVNLLDIYGNASETNINMTFYDNFSGSIKYNFIHTMNNRGIPDTIVVDHLSMYDLVVHSIPEVRKDSISLIAGKHNIVAVDVPQGFLTLKASGMTVYRDLKAIIRKKGSMETLYVQNFNEIQKFLVGKYDVEVLCLPRMYINDVEITQNTTTTVEIPQPGIALIQRPAAGFGSLYVEKNNTLKLLLNLSENTTQETVILQPGKYRVVFRSKFSTKTINTVERIFTIESGKTQTIKIM